MSIARIPPPGNALVSFHYYRNFDLDRLSNLRLIGDSGAFSAASVGATMETRELALWARQWSHRLTWTACLDVIGDQEATRRNWHEMVDDYGVRAIPTIHHGCSPTALDYYAARDVDFVGLGGLVGVSRPRQMRWLVSVFRYARRQHPQMRFHGWGATGADLLQLPFYSVDSSAWTAPMRYGRIVLRHPRTGTGVNVVLRGRETYKKDIADLLRYWYGVNPSRVAKSGPDNRDLITYLSALSLSVQEQTFRRKHGAISAPHWLVRDTTPGPHIHIVTTDRSNLTQVNGMNDRRDDALAVPAVKEMQP